MKAPEWYKTQGTAIRVPPPPLPSLDSGAPGGDSGGASGSGGRPAVPALPTVPAAPPGAVLALPPSRPPALPGLAALPPPPPPPAAKGSGQLGLAIQSASKAAAKAIVVSAAPKKKKEVDDRAFMIPGLQDRPFTDDEVDVAFEMMDVDNKKYLDAQDIRRVLDLIGDGDIPDPEVDEMIRLCDPGGTKEVDKKEFKTLFVDPPAIFRNFDLQRRAGLSKDVATERRSSKLGAAAAIANGSKDLPAIAGDDPREEAVGMIVGGARLRPGFVKDVYHRFVEIDVEDRGFVDYESFCAILQRPQTEEMKSAFDAFDIARIGEVDLRQLVVGLSMFSDASLNDRLRFGFMMYDEEQRGSLHRSDLQEVIQSVAPHLAEFVRNRHVDRLYAEHGIHENARVSLDVFLEYMQEHIGALLRHEAKDDTVSRSGSRSVTASLPPALANTSGSNSQLASRYASKLSRGTASSSMSSPPQSALRAIGPRAGSMSPTSSG